jgi:hypothetical protein
VITRALKPTYGIEVVINEDGTLSLTQGAGINEGTQLIALSKREAAWLQRQLGELIAEMEEDEA